MERSEDLGESGGSESRRTPQDDRRTPQDDRKTPQDDRRTPQDTGKTALGKLHKSLFIKCTE